MAFDLPPSAFFLLLRVGAQSGTKTHQQCHFGQQWLGEEKSVWSL